MRALQYTPNIFQAVSGNQNVALPLVTINTDPGTALSALQEINLVSVGLEALNLAVIIKAALPLITISSSSLTHTVTVGGVGSSPGGAIIEIGDLLDITTVLG